MVKKGDRGRQVREIQTLLDFHGFWTYSKITDYFGNVTESAVKRFQTDRGLIIDGLVGDKTLNELLKGVDADITIHDVSNDTDDKLEYLGSYQSDGGLFINRVYLDSDEYVRDYGKIEPINLVIHHTAGWDNPYSTVNSWNTDRRGRVATQYIIGGQNIRGNTKHDGTVVETFPNNYLGWHMGKVGSFENMSKLAVGIEISNFGYLEEKNGKFYNYVDYEVPKNQVCDLGYKFRGYQYWHNYSDKQIESLGKLIEHIKNIYPEINTSNGIPRLLNQGVEPNEAFEFNTNAYYGKELGVWSHTSARKDKFDCYPHPKLVELLKSLF